MEQVSSTQEVRQQINAEIRRLQEKAGDGTRGLGEAMKDTIVDGLLYIYIYNYSIIYYTVYDLI